MIPGQRRGLPDPGETPRPELCDFCGDHEVRWYRTANAQPMAVDVEPDAERGNVRIVDGIAVAFGKDKAAAQRAAGHRLYLNHRVSCPRSDLWPKPKKPAHSGPPDKTRETGTPSGRPRRRGAPTASHARDGRRADRASPPAGPQPGPLGLFDLPDR